MNGHILQIVFVPGGHGIIYDGPGNRKLASVLTEAYAAGNTANAVFDFDE